MSALPNPAGAIAPSFDAARGLATLRLTGPGADNVLDEPLATALVEAVAWAHALPGLRGLIVSSAHPDFCRGPDPDRWLATPDAAALLARVRRVQQALRRLETCGVPVVAVLAGAVSDGGLELALACHRRVAVDDPRLRLELPALAFGLLPAAGATQRLPRLLGLGPALELLLRPAPLGGESARRAGLVDALFADHEAALADAAGWLATRPDPAQAYDRPGWVLPGPAPRSTAARDLVLSAAGALHQRTAGSQPAPELLLRAIHEGCGLVLDRALEVEARLAVSAARSATTGALIRTLWQHRRQAEALTGGAGGAAGQRVGILGAGLMGAGLAYHCATRGCEVVLRDVDPAALDRARERWARRSPGDGPAVPGALSPSAHAAALARITLTLALEPLAGCALLIEAVDEALALKQRVLAETEPLLAPGALWASNTSALPLASIAAQARDPARVLGLHFFSPVERMPLLEIVRGALTSEATLERALAFAGALGKAPIVVGDGYGFYTTRVFLAYLVEGAELVAEGHTPALVEWAARHAGMAVGPLQVADEVGLALARQILAGAQQQLGRPAASPGTRLLAALVETEGRGGRAAGAGYYSYVEGQRRGLWPGLGALSAPGRVGQSVARDSAAQVGQRLLLIQGVEAVRALAEGIVTHARDADLGAVLGLGFAPGTGGPLAYLDRLGLPAACARLDALAAVHGARFAPPPLLREAAARGEPFYPVTE
ncbi:MAG: enoyl-CoA hydratase/isomerase family protein [Proteobacteria bacterium]|nr:enoyl-CoA hydratase/isomerase family protein [Pseudomonadota bacterium]